MTKLLILGGTSDAKALATQLHLTDIPFIYSIQGNVRNLNAEFDVHVGGFGQYTGIHLNDRSFTLMKDTGTETGQQTSINGLCAFLTQNHITHIVDCTHPYATSISSNAIKAASQIGLSYLQYCRPAWDIEKLARPPWNLSVSEYDSYSEILKHLGECHRNCQHVFWAAGLKSLRELTSHHLKQQRNNHKQDWYFRTAVTVLSPEIATSMSNKQSAISIKTIHQVGPFSLENEISLFTQYQIDGLVCKNSGGVVNETKLQAASILQIPVFMLKRPNKIQQNADFSSIDELFNAIIAITKSSITP